MTEPTSPLADALLAAEVQASARIDPDPAGPRFTWAWLLGTAPPTTLHRGLVSQLWGQADRLIDGAGDRFIPHDPDQRRLLTLLRAIRAGGPDAEAARAEAQQVIAARGWSGGPVTAYLTDR